MYSLINIVMIFLVVAPFTLRTAISLRRCSQLSVINEKMPNMVIRIHTIDTKDINFINTFSDFRYSS